MSWTSIECIERNGIIESYQVEFQTVDGTRIVVETETMTFTASGLKPFTNYTFRVAGINSEGKGPFTDGITVFTKEDGMVLANNI